MGAAEDVLASHAFTRTQADKLIALLHAAIADPAFGVVRTTGDQSIDGIKTFLQKVYIIANHLRLGPVAYPASYEQFVGSAYLTLDKITEEDDCSIVYRQGGDVKWELGATTELPGEPNDFHLKRVTGTAGSETFTDVMIVSHTTGDTRIIDGFKLGVGTTPTELLHVADTQVAARVIAKIENGNTTGAGSRSAIWQFAGDSTNWVVGNDFGLNGGHNFFVQDGIAGSNSVRIFADANGVAINGQTIADTESLVVSSLGGKGFLPPLLTTVQRDAMGGKNSGLTIFNSTVNKLQSWVAPLATWRTFITRGYAEELVPVVEQNIVWWGDSLTAGSGGTPPTDAFNDLYGPAAVVNEGVGGETSTQIKDRFIAEPQLDNIQIIWAGRNNFGSPVTVKADIATMVAAMSHSRYIILGILNQDTAAEQNTSGTDYVTITTLNSDLATLYGDKFIDVRTILIENGLDMAGITATAADLIDIGLDVPPESLRSDTLHLNTAGYAVVAQIVRAHLHRAINDGNYVTVDGAQTITGAKTFSAASVFSSVATFNAGILIATGGSFAQGKIYRSASLGLVVGPIAGSSYDFDLTDRSGNDCLTMAANTDNLTAWGNFYTVGRNEGTYFEHTMGGMFRANETASITTDLPTAGRAVEIWYRTDGGSDFGNILSFNRGTGAYKDLKVRGLTVVLGAGSTDIATVATTGLTIESGHLRSNSMHNNATSPTGTSPQYVASGTYTPTLTNVANVAGSTAYVCQWMRVGNVVTVSGKVDIDPTAASTATELGISLPLASAFTLEQQCGGTSANHVVASLVARIDADATNDRARLRFIHGDAANRAHSFSFTYLVL